MCQNQKRSHCNPYSLIYICQCLLWLTCSLDDWGIRIRFLSGGD